MKRFMKKLAVQCACVVFCFFATSNFAYADTIKTKAITITVSLSDELKGVENSSSLALLARDTIPNLMVRDDDMGAVFEKSGEDFVAKVSIPVGYNYYLIGKNTGSKTYLNTDQFTYDNSRDTVTIVLQKNGEASPDTPTTGNASNLENTVASAVDASGILAKGKESASTAASGDVVSYTLDELYNKTGAIADNFSFHVTVPSGSSIDNFFSGKYNKETSMSLSYRTNKNSTWKFASDNISSTVPQRFNASELGLAEGEYITEFIFSAESVPDGFAMSSEEPLSYGVKISNDSSDGKKIDVSTALSTYINAQKYQSGNVNSATVVNVVQTGDGNILYLISLIGLIVSVVAAVLYFIYICVSKRPVKKTDASKNPFANERFRDYM